MKLVYHKFCKAVSLQKSVFSGSEISRFGWQGSGNSSITTKIWKILGQHLLNHRGQMLVHDASPIHLN